MVLLKVECVCAHNLSQIVDPEGLCKDCPGVAEGGELAVLIHKCAEARGRAKRAIPPDNQTAVVDPQGRGFTRPGKIYALKFAVLVEVGVIRSAGPANRHAEVVNGICKGVRVRSREVQRHETSASHPESLGYEYRSTPANHVASVVDSINEGRAVAAVVDSGE